MHFATDESGSFALDRGSFEASILTTLVCPESVRPTLTEFVAECCADWGLEELHAHRLQPHQRVKIAAFLANLDLIWTTTLIDNELFPGAAVKPWRETLADNFERSWQRSQARGSTHPTYQGRGEQIRRLLRGGASTASFVEYGIAMPRHIHDAVQAAIRHFRDRRWRDEWCSPRLLFDNKDRYGEHLLENILFPILATDAMALNLPIDYQEAQHPLRAAHRSPTSGIELVSFFGDGPQFTRSHEEPLIQLADLVCWVAQRALRFPEDTEAQAAYRILRRRHFRTDVGRFRFMSRRQIALADLHRYRHLLGLA